MAHSPVAGAVSLSVSLADSADPRLESAFHALPDKVRQELDRSEQLRQQAAREQSEAAQLARNAARRLAEQGLPLRDVGSVLGVSFQRAKQLVDEGKNLVKVDAR